MTTAQREYLKKLLTGFAIAAYGIICVIFAAIGSQNNNWLIWVSLAMMGLPAAVIAFCVIYVPIATTVWRWRLMGECHTEWEGRVLKRWWFFIARSDSWVDYLIEEIEDYDVEKEVQQKYLDFLHRLEKVKKPRGL